MALVACRAAAIESSHVALPMHLIPCKCYCIVLYHIHYVLLVARSTWSCEQHKHEQNRSGSGTKEFCTGWANSYGKQTYRVPTKRGDREPSPGKSLSFGDFIMCF